MNRRGGEQITLFEDNAILCITLKPINTFGNIAGSKINIHHLVGFLFINELENMLRNKLGKQPYF